jgi:lipoate-protein ligase A
VDLAAAHRLGVDVVRRMSGGSAIYTDPEQLIYSVVVGRDAVPESPLETFRLLCQGVIDALHRLGVEASFKPVNDVLVNGRKISGSAQIRRHGVVLQHGTLLVRNDYERMFAVLRASKRARDDMTSLAEVLTVAPSMDAVKGAVVEGFSHALGISIVSGQLTELERRTADELSVRYGSGEHTGLY